MRAVAAWRGVFIERLKSTGNVTLAAAEAGVSRQQVYRTRNRNRTFRLRQISGRARGSLV